MGHLVVAEFAGIWLGADAELTSRLESSSSRLVVSGATAVRASTGLGFHAFRCTFMEQ